MFSLLDIPIHPPNTWQHFETLCWDIFGKIYGLPNTQKIGRQGQSQNGVDIVSFAISEKQWIGIQCKQKDTYPAKSFSKRDLISAINKVRKFQPPLNQFFIVTSAPRDEKIQKIIREISEENAKTGLFFVKVYFWNDLEDLIRKYPDIYQQYYSRIDELLTKSENPKYETLKTDIADKINSDSKVQQSTVIVGVNEIIQSTLSSKYFQDLDQIKKHLDSNKPTIAQEILLPLKQRIWDTAPPDIRFRILTYEAVIKLQLLDYLDAGKKLIEALQYNLDDEKALGNAAMGYHLNHMYTEAIKFASKVLEKNPISTYAYHVLILSKAHSESIESIISTIPKELLTNSDISAAIGQCFFNLERFEESSYWLEISLKDSKENVIQIKGLFASSLINKVKNDEKSLKGLQISKNIQLNLEHAIRLFDEVIINTSHDSNLQKSHVGWFIERSTGKRLLGDLKGSSNDLNDAYRLDPENPLVIFFKGLIEFEFKNFPDAEKNFKQVLWEKSTPGALWVYLYSLKLQKKYDYGIEKILEFKQKISNKDQEDTLEHFLIEFNVGKGKDFFETAESIALSRYENDEDDILKTIDLINVYGVIGKNQEIQKIIEILKTKNLEILPPSILVVVADTFYNLNYFQDAAKNFDRIVDPTINSSLTQKLIASFYLIGNHKQALDLCRTLHANQGPQQYSSSIELAIYQEIGDIPESIRICQEYLEKNPDDYEMRIDQARVNLLANRIQDVESFLRLGIDDKKITFALGLKMVGLNFCINQFDDALRLSYLLRSKFSKVPEAHLAYINLIMNIEDRSTILTKPKKVSVNSIVEVEDNFHRINTYIINDLGSIDNIASDLQINDPLTKKILNKKEKNKIILGTKNWKNSIIIKKVMNKFVFAFQDSVNNFNQRFPDHPGFYLIPFGTGPDGKITDGDMQQIRTLVENNQKNNEYFIDFYRKSQFTIGAVAESLKKDIFSTCSHLISIPDVGIQSFIQRPDINSDYHNVLKNKPRVIIDPTAIFTLSCLNIGDQIVKKFGKLGVAQSSICLLQDFILDLSGRKSIGYLNINLINKSLVGDEVTAEQNQKIREHYKKILDWITKNCDVLPCYKSLTLNNIEKRKYDSLFGKAFVDSMLLASQDGMILYSDDGLLHIAAQQLFKCKSVWTQFLISNLLSDNSISSDQFDEFAITLLHLHYYPPTLNVSILLKTAEKSQWQLGQSFLNCLRILGDQRLDLDLSIRIGVEFAVLLWIKCKNFEDRGLLLLKTLSVLSTRREKSELVGIFIYTINAFSTITNDDKKEIFWIITTFDSMFS